MLSDKRDCYNTVIYVLLAILLMFSTINNVKIFNENNKKLRIGTVLIFLF